MSDIASNIPLAKPIKPPTIAPAPAAGAPPTPVADVPAPNPINAPVPAPLPAARAILTPACHQPVSTGAT